MSGRHVTSQYGVTTSHPHVMSQKDVIWAKRLKNDQCGRCVNAQAFSCLDVLAKMAVNLSSWVDSTKLDLSIQKGCIHQIQILFVFSLDVPIIEIVNILPIKRWVSFYHFIQMCQFQIKPSSILVRCRFLNINVDVPIEQLILFNCTSKRQILFL